MLKMVRLGQGNSSPFIAVPPDAPTIETATRGDQQATVTFTPPAYDGGAQITSYIVTASPGGLSGQAVGSPITVYGLTNGVSYTFTVKAGNSAGFGASSPASNAVTPAGVPFAPAIGTATGGNGQAVVNFTSNGDNGAPITSFTATSSPGGLTGTSASSPIIVSGLTNGTPYTFTVRATNAVGQSNASPPSNSVTPATVPGAPTIGTATVGVNQATVAFTAPASNGGSAITGYTVTSTPGGITATGEASPITVTGLSPGVAYTFKVKATNAIGTGAESAASNSVTTPNVPGAPVFLSATAGIGSVTINFTAPASDGGSAITHYIAGVSVVGSGIWENYTFGWGSPITVTGLAHGTQYYLSVVATNAVGDGPGFAVQTVTTPNVPAAPTIGTATAGIRQATVSFTPGANNGSAITHYTVTSSPGGIVATGSASPITVSGLANNTAYTFTVTATNGVGTSAASAASNSATTFNVPGAPTGVVADFPDITSMRLTFSAPASNGGSPITGYTATSSPGGITGTSSGASPQINMGGLTAGTTYTFTVTATNAVGTGPASAPSNSATTLTPTPPDPPTGVTGSPDNGGAPGANRTIFVYFTPPANQGGGPITGYKVNRMSGGFPVETIAGSSSPIAFPNLTQGANYIFTAQATNAYGDSGNSVQSAAVKIVNFPGAPTNPISKGLDSSAELKWDAPTNDGGNPVSEYYVYISVNGGSFNYHSSHAASVAGTYVIISGLTNGNSYAFRIAASNGVFNSYNAGLYASTGPVTPVYVPPPVSMQVTPDAIGANATYPNRAQANTTADVWGGVGPFTYSWYWQSGGTGLEILNATSATVTVRTTVPINEYGTYTGTLACSVTDTGEPERKPVVDTCYVEFTQYPS